MEENNKNTTDIITHLSDLEKRVTDIEKRLRDTSVDFVTSKTKKPSVKEFLIDKQPKDEVQCTLAIGYFLEKVKDFMSFNAADLKVEFRAAKVPLPKNVNDKVNINIKKGYMMEAESKKDKQKAWVLTSTGEKYVEEELNK